MTNIITIKNLYFGGINGFRESDIVDDAGKSCDADCSSSAEAVNIDPDVMVKTIASVERIDPETVRKVLTGANRFLKCVRKEAGYGR